MSVEEQDQILGRLTRESRESRQRIAALNAKLQEFRDRCRDVSVAFSSFDGPAFAGAVRAAKALPDRSAVLDALEELRLEQERLQGIGAQLSSF